VRTYSGVAEYVFFVLFIVPYPRWSSFSGEKIDPTDESISHVMLRETKEEVGIDEEKTEILGKPGPLSGPRPGPRR